MEFIIKKADIYHSLFDQKSFDEIKKSSVYLAQGGSGKVYTRKNEIIKIEKLYTQSKNYKNSDFYVCPSKDCCYIKESFLLETIVMETLSRVSVIIPKLYNVLIGKEGDVTYSMIVMEKQKGIPYMDYYNNVSRDRLYHTWFHFFEDMKLLYETFSFIHGDLIKDNIYVYYDRIRLIDFGLSLIKIKNISFMRYHVVPRLKKLNPGMNMKKIGGIDICKLLYREKFEDNKKLQQIFDSCEGVSGRRNLKTGYYPNPVYVHSEEMTFDVILRELEKKMKPI